MTYQRPRGRTWSPPGIRLPDRPGAVEHRFSPFEQGPCLHAAAHSEPVHPEKAAPPEGRAWQPGQRWNDIRWDGEAVVKRIASGPHGGERPSESGDKVSFSRSRGCGNVGNPVGLSKACGQARPDAGGARETDSGLSTGRHFHSPRPAACLEVVEELWQPAGVVAAARGDDRPLPWLLRQLAGRGQAGAAAAH
jgi:hypothetical protein